MLSSLLDNLHLSPENILVPASMVTAAASDDGQLATFSCSVSSHLGVLGISTIDFHLDQAKRLTILKRVYDTGIREMRELKVNGHPSVTWK
jgi:cyanophycinase-like exopeptidase